MAVNVTPETKPIEIKPYFGSESKPGLDPDLKRGLYALVAILGSVSVCGAISFLANL